jgi:fumarate reductase subunit D
MNADGEPLARRIIFLTLAGYLMPPLVWFATVKTANLVETWNELLALALSPITNIYIAAYLVAVVFAMRRQIHRIVEARGSQDAEKLAQARKATRQIPVGGGHGDPAHTGIRNAFSHCAGHGHRKVHRRFAAE